MTLFTFIALTLAGCAGSLVGAIGDSEYYTPEQRFARYQVRQQELSPQEWEKKVNSTSTLDRCFSALQCAIRDRSFETAEFLLNSGADPNIGGVSRFNTGQIREYNYYISYPIQDAVRYAESDDEANNLVQLLLKHGSKTDYATRNFGPALHFAIKKGYLTTVDTLLGAGANTGVVTSVDPSGLSYELDRAGQAMSYGAPLTVAVNHLKYPSFTSEAIIRSLLRAGADPYDMRFVEGSPSLGVYLLQRGKPGMVEDALKTYSEVKGMNRDQYAALKQEVEEEYQAYLKEEQKKEQEKAERLAAERIAREKAAEARRRAREVQAANEAYEANIRRQLDSGMYDESNSWVEPITSALKDAADRAENNTKPIIVVSPPPRHHSASAGPKTPVAGQPKRVDNSCDNSPHCKATSYDGPYLFTRLITGRGRGYNNATACEESREHARPNGVCNVIENGKTVVVYGMGVAFEVCECNELEFKSECTTKATWYCGDPSPKHGHGVMVE